MYILVHSNGFLVKIGPCQHGKYVCLVNKDLVIHFLTVVQVKRLLKIKQSFQFLLIYMYMYMYFKSTDIMFKDN